MPRARDERAASKPRKPTQGSSAEDLTILEDDLTGPAVQALLRAHLAAMHEVSPPGTVHALDLAGLRAPNVTFLSAWLGDPSAGRLAGCGALAELDPDHDELQGELKSMRTHPAYLRCGVASAVLTHLIEVARTRGYVRLSLETGSGPAFEAAGALYRRHGFVSTAPFADYIDDPFSRFLSLDLTE